MKRFFLPGIIVATLAIIIGGVVLTSKNSPATPSPLPSPTALEYYWGNGCPHCANVEAFLESWDKKDKVSLDKKEVWNNPKNASDMLTRAKTCNLDTEKLAVPMLVTPEGKCLVGDTPIIDYFKSLSL